MNILFSIILVLHIILLYEIRIGILIYMYVVYEQLYVFSVLLRNYSLKNK